MYKARPLQFIRAGSHRPFYGLRAYMTADGVFTILYRNEYWRIRAVRKASSTQPLLTIFNEAELHEAQFETLTDAISVLETVLSADTVSI